MIKHKEKNKYSLNAESYGISKVRWKDIKERVIASDMDSESAIKRFMLYHTIKDGILVLDEDLCKKRLWFLYDILLQEKYNHLYKRDKLVNPKEGDFVYCDYEGFGRGEIVNICETENIMAVKFKERNFPTLCSSVDMVTIHDNIKRKITKL